MMPFRTFFASACVILVPLFAVAGQDSSNPSIKISREPLVSDHISPLQYGQFVEYLCNLVPGMWSEKLYDGSFEGLSPYRFAFLRETDFREKPWYPSGATNRAEFSLDRKDPVSGQVSKKIEAREAVPCMVGISQDGIAVERGKTCTFTCYLRQKGIQKRSEEHTSELQSLAYLVCRLL